MGATKITDETTILQIVNKIYEEKPTAVQAAIKDPNAINYLVGLTMKATKGQADPKVINQVIRMKLEAG